MRSYDQFCPVAKALDVVGDRWTLLLVRELFLRGPSRYTDLRNGLPGIASNLLADRLRQLEEAGLVSREEAPPPIATTLFRLTPRGEELKPVVQALGRWGAALMTEAGPDDEFRSRWLTFPAQLFLSDREPDKPPIAIELRAGEEPVVIETAGGNVVTRAGSAENPDAVLAGPPELIVGLLAGRLDLADARKRGLEYQGDAAALRRLQPEAA